MMMRLGRIMSNGGSNIRGNAAEREVRKITGGEKADLAYATTLGYDCKIDADCVLNRGTARELILTVTHCNPSSPRQSLENKFQNKLGGDSRSEFRRHARGNTLFDNSAGGTFSDTSETAAVTLGRWAWSSNFIDFNNDGWEDIFVANGYVTNEDTGDL